ncbi:BTAD domain-containing putative transcriptional regulator [Actinoplanes sp. NPDC051343]|uniref:AfsR/SARP family transcriptional regulator n=1 Tax=Actinoplanes sp. NPDC051343 TaxID=3363906 RepID=UPI0037883629
MRTLLVSLILSAERPVFTDVLAGQLWPDRAPAHVRGTVHTYVARLRRLFGHELIRTTSGGGYLLAVPSGNIDIHQFHGLLRQARAAEAADQELALLRAALALWRGRPFTGVESPWLDREVVPPLVDEWFAATERRIDLELKSGHASELVAELRDLTNQHATRESLWFRLIVALHQAGRRAEALDAYQQVRRILGDELGIDPSAELQQLQRALLQDGVTAPPTAPGPVPDRRPPRQLPHDIVNFSGRTAELADLDALLAAADSADGRGATIVSIEGAPGMGKTSLALHWAHRVSDRYPDAHLYLNLHGHGPGEPITPAAAAAILLRGLGISNGVIPPDADERAALLRTTLAGLRVLVMLDNARNSDQVRALLPGMDCLVIVTSRNQLRGLSVRDGALRVTLHSLAVAESISFLSAVLSARRISAEPDAAARLVEICGGLPLALSIVAERAHRSGTLSDVVHALEDEKARLDNFVTGESDPHTDLRAALSWSYQALGSNAAAMFDMLGLHPAADIGLDCAAALAGLPVREAQQSLDQLVEANMVQRRQRDRYELHDLIRLYATDRMVCDGAASASEAAIRRLLDWCLHAAVSADTALMPTRRRNFLDPYTPTMAVPVFADQHQAMAWFEREYDCLRSVVNWAASHGRPGHAWRTVIAMTTFLDRRIPWREGIEFLEMARQAAESALESAGEGYTLNSLGCTYWDQRDWVRAKDYFRKALARFSAIGDRTCEAMTLGNLGLVHASAGEAEEAQRLCGEALRLCEQSGFRRGVAQNLDNLGQAFSAAGEYHRAIECHQQASVLFHELGVTEEGACNEQNLGLAYAAGGYYGKSVRSLRLATVTLRRLSHRRQEANLLVDLGNTLQAANHPGLARQCWQAALKIMRELADPRVANIEAQIASTDLYPT